MHAVHKESFLIVSNGNYVLLLCAKKSYCNVNRHDIVLEILKILSTLDPGWKCSQMLAEGTRIQEGANTLAKSRKIIEKNAKKKLAMLGLSCSLWDFSCSILDLVFLIRD